MAMTKQFYWYLYVSSMCNEFASHVVCAFRNGGVVSVSANKVYGIANSSFCVSSYMLTQSIADYLILKGPLPASYVFSPVFQSFVLNSHYLTNSKPFSNILFQSNPVLTSTTHFLKIQPNFHRCSMCVLHRSIVTLFSHLRLILPSGFLPSGFHTKIPHMLLPFPYALYDPHISFFWILYTHSAGWGAEITKLLIM